ncbi:unnamed protein product, partial [Closterium sp. NIES-53]
FPPPFVDKHLSLSSYHAQLTHPTQVSFRQRSHRLHSRQHLCAEGSDMAVRGTLGLLHLPSPLTMRNSLTPHRYIERNNLTGSIPDSIAALTALEYLYLGGSSLTGSIPDRISALQDLTWL